MRKSIPLKIVAAGAGILMTGGVAAAAVTTPDEAPDGLTNASEKAGFEVPTSGEAQPAKNQNEVEETVEETTELEVTTTTEAEDDAETKDADGEATGPVDNHGAVVSEFAQTTELEGRERGQAIADVAKSDEGKPEAAEADTENSATEASADDADDSSDEGANPDDQAAARANGKRG